MNCLTCPDRFTCWSDCHYGAAQDDINTALAARGGTSSPAIGHSANAALFHHPGLQG